MTTNHRVWTSDPDDNDRVHWECSCGAAGSCPDFRAAVASDVHIRPGETRSEISKPDW